MGVSWNVFVSGQGNGHEVPRHTSWKIDTVALQDFREARCIVVAAAACVVISSNEATLLHWKQGMPRQRPKSRSLSAVDSEKGPLAPPEDTAFTDLSQTAVHCTRGCGFLVGGRREATSAFQLMEEPKKKKRNLSGVRELSAGRHERL